MLRAATALAHIMLSQFWRGDQIIFGLIYYIIKCVEGQLLRPNGSSSLLSANPEEHRLQFVENLPNKSFFHFGRQTVYRPKRFKSVSSKLHVQRPDLRYSSMNSVTSRTSQLTTHSNSSINGVTSRTSQLTTHSN